MSYRIVQDYEYVGKDYWRWWARIEADDDAELDKVKEVVWILHPSFHHSRVVAKQRSNNFRLVTAGWGTFLLRAEVVLANGEKLLLQHNLRLDYPEPSGSKPRQKDFASAQEQRLPTVFLSYSMQDARVAAEIRDEIEKAGLKVLDQTRLREGDPVGLVIST
jgi:transcription initiation factor IIF auxiliary subunit